MRNNRLMRSSSDKKIFGLCGGLGEYFCIDPVVFRVIFVLSALCGFIGLVVYLVMALVLPVNPDVVIGRGSYPKLLRRPRRGSKLFGVCDAIANFFDFDVTVLRVIFVICALFGAGIVFYIVCALCIPVED